MAYAIAKRAMQPRRIAPVVCFWCEQPGKITVDHVISRPIRRYLKWHGCRRPTVSCCFECNQKRARISSLFRVLVYNLRPMLKRGDPWAKDSEAKWLRLRAIAMPDIEWLARQYEAKLDGDCLIACQAELRELGYTLE